MSAVGKLVEDTAAQNEEQAANEEYIKAAQDTGKSLHDLYKAVNGDMGALEKRTTDLEIAVDEHGKALASDNGQRPRDGHEGSGEAPEAKIDIENLAIQVGSPLNK